jgi:hypothetical protein
VLSVEECRSRANECIQVAKLTPDDRAASQGWRQLAEVWLTLAEQSSAPASSEMRLIVDFGQVVEQPATREIPAITIGEALRERLTLVGEPSR